MSFQEHTKPENLERYSFLWSEIRLIIAAVALFMGGVPPVLAFNPIPAFYGLLSSLLTISWIISGIASGYLLYRWNVGSRRIFGRQNSMDMILLFVMIISGFNLGIAGIFSKNIGMTISSNSLVFIIVGIIYLISAWYLFKEWKKNGRRVF